MNGGGAAAAAIANAIKASGVIVRLKEEDFIKVISRADNPAVVVSRGGFMKKDFDYLLAYKGFVFFARTKEEINLPGNAEIIAAQQIWIPY
ncbi:hypothetical protein JW879_08825 [candidate division WOR-3 bacterium]|nr:hypothetical protein [candidate division WOR-3 bacterium]